MNRGLPVVTGWTAAVEGTGQDDCAGEIAALPVESPDEAWENVYGYEWWQAQCDECGWFGPRRWQEREAETDIPATHQVVSQ